MQPITFKSCFLLLLLPIFSFAQVGVNTTTPNAMLDVSATDNGILIPRVGLSSATDIVSVVNPQGGALVTSTLVYNTATGGVSPNNVTPGFYYWDATRWVAISGTRDWTLNGNAAIVNPAAPATYGTSPIGSTENFIGTTDNNDVTVGTNNIERLRVKNTTGNVGVGTANPTEKVHVFQNSNSNKSSIFSEAGQISSGADYQNTAVKGFGKGFAVSPSNLWGYANGVMGIADINSSYYSTGIYAHLGSTTPNLPNSNQALFANGNNLGYSGVFMGGNVGIGTQAPSLAKLQVEGMVGNTMAIFKGSATTQGIALVSDWPGIYFNCYYNGGLFGMSGNGFPSIVNTDQTTGAITFQTTDVPTIGGPVTVPERMRVDGNGNIGIGVTNPAHRLHVRTTTSAAWAAHAENTYTGNSDGRAFNGRSVNNPGYGYGGYMEGGYIGLRGNGVGTTNTGATYGVFGNATGTTGVGTRIGGYFTASGGATNYALQAAGKVRINDGTQGVGKVLTSDALGVASWDDVAINNVVGVLGAGASVSYTTGPYLQTGSYIILPPGKYAVNVTMLLAKASLTFSPNNSFFWVRSTFSNSGGINPMPSPDIVGSNLCSGNYPGTSVYSLLSGSVIINNTSGANRTYYYVAGNVVTTNTTETLSYVGGNYWAENNIIAFRLN